jgi:hypothetical protein
MRRLASRTGEEFETVLEQTKPAEVIDRALNLMLSARTNPRAKLFGRFELARTDRALDCPAMDAGSFRQFVHATGQASSGWAASAIGGAAAAPLAGSAPTLDFLPAFPAEAPIAFAALASHAATVDAAIRAAIDRSCGVSAAKG